MKIILTEDQYGQLTEMIKLDIKVGDTIMGGKFKNKKVIVKTIGKNDKGDITINGKPLLRFRIIKESNTAVLRRQNRIEELFHDYLLSHNVTPQDSFDSFFQTLCWDIAVTIVDRTNVTLRNQIIRFIKNNYYEEFKGWWERRQKKMGISENTNESVPKDIEKRYKTYSKLLNELTEEFDWVSKIDVKLSSTADSGGWRNEQSKPLVKISVYFKNYQKITMTEQFELFDEIKFIHDMFFPHLTGDPLIYSDNITAYFSTKSVFPNGKTDSFPSHNQIVLGDYDAVSQISESNEKNKIGSENFNRLLTKVVNSIINEYLKKTTTIDHDFDFRVKVRKGTDTPFVGCNAGSHGEPYNYVIEVYSDIEIPKYFTYNDEYKKNHNKISDGFHNSILSREIKDILPMIGLDIESLGNVFGVCFKGKTEDFSSNKPVSQISESNDKNKIFLKDKFGIDLDGKIKMIQSYEDLPLMFASHYYPKDFNRMLNDGGPFYVMNITKGYKIGNKYVNKLYLYRPRVDGSSFLVDQDGYNKAESTFLENLGVDVMGLTIEDLVNIYFNEEDQI